jgi:hypothetical protein
MLELKRIYWTRQTVRVAGFCAMIWLLAAAFFALMPNVSKPAAGRHATSVIAVLEQVFGGVLAAIAAPGAVLVVLMIIAGIMRGRELRRRDPVRRFTRQQRLEGMARAQGQCEMEVPFRRRCSRPAEHGDHFYPWSRGGSTSLQNFVAACATCNRAKGASLPTPGQQRRLQGRRRGYVGLEEAVLVGERRTLG